MPVAASIFLPALFYTSFDRHGQYMLWQHITAIGVVLGIKPFQTRSGNDASCYTLALQCFTCLNCQLHFVHTTAQYNSRNGFDIIVGSIHQDVNTEWYIFSRAESVLTTVIYWYTLTG